MAHNSPEETPIVRRKDGEDILSARLREHSENFFTLPVDLVAALERDPGGTLDSLASDPSSIAPLRESPGSDAYRTLYSSLLKDSLRVVRGIILAEKIVEASRIRRLQDR